MAPGTILETLAPRQQQILEAAHECTETGNSVDMASLVAELGEVDSPQHRAAIRSTIFALDKKGQWPFPIQRRTRRKTNGGQTVRLDNPATKKRGRPGRKPSARGQLTKALNELQSMGTSQGNGETTASRFQRVSSNRLHPELAAMESIWESLQRLSEQRRHRVLVWLVACATEETV